MIHGGSEQARLDGEQGENRRGEQFQRGMGGNLDADGTGRRDGRSPVNTVAAKPVKIAPGGTRDTAPEAEPHISIGKARVFRRFCRRTASRDVNRRICVQLTTAYPRPGWSSTRDGPSGRIAVLAELEHHLSCFQYALVSPGVITVIWEQIERWLGFLATRSPAPPLPRPP